MSSVLQCKEEELAEAQTMANTRNERVCIWTDRDGNRRIEPLADAPRESMYNRTVVLPTAEKCQAGSPKMDYHESQLELLHDGDVITGTRPLPPEKTGDSVQMERTIQTQHGILHNLDSVKHPWMGRDIVWLHSGHFRIGRVLAIVPAGTYPQDTFDRELAKLTLPDPFDNTPSRYGHVKTFCPHPQGWVSVEKAERTGLKATSPRPFNSFLVLSWPQQYDAYDTRVRQCHGRLRCYWPRMLPYYGPWRVEANVQNPGDNLPANKVTLPTGVWADYYSIPRVQEFFKRHHITVLKDA